MTYDLEIMLRQNERVFAERLSHDRECEAWTEDDVERVVKDILGAINQTMNADDLESRSVNLRGLSWIVNPYRDGVVLAFEIHSASAVAGPFRISQEKLTQLMSRVVEAGQSKGPVH